MENNGTTPILIETATVPGTEAGDVRNADKLWNTEWPYSGTHNTSY